MLERIYKANQALKNFIFCFLALLGAIILYNSIDVVMAFQTDSEIFINAIGDLAYQETAAERKLFFYALLFLPFTLAIHLILGVVLYHKHSDKIYEQFKKEVKKEVLREKLERRIKK